MTVPATKASASAEQHSSPDHLHRKDGSCDSNIDGAPLVAIQEWVQYKVLLLTFKALNGLAPQYLADLLKTYVPQRQLRSSAKSMLVVPKTNTKTYGTRGFGRVAPSLWNGWPETLKNAQSVTSFKRLLKTFLFITAY